MRRIVYTLGGAGGVLFGFATAWAVPPGGSPPFAPTHVQESSGIATISITMLAAMVAGLVGGALAAWLGQRGIRRSMGDLDSRLIKLARDLGDLASRTSELEREFRSGVNDRRDDGGRVYGDAADDASTNSPSQADPPRRRSAADRPRRSKPEPLAATSPEPPTSHQTVDEIASRFGQVAAGQISRAAFARFFEELGPSGGVRVEREGMSIDAASGGEELLTAVNTDAGILVFPSYQFISNQPTQFATIASVPDQIASIFDLSPGRDGDLVVRRPAIFEEVDGETRRIARGELGGFGG